MSSWSAATAVSRRSPGTASSTLEPGERFVTRSAGGGGVGDSFARPPEMVRADVVEGFVSVAGAREEYGVVIDATTLLLDAEATAQLRAGPG